VERETAYKKVSQRGGASQGEKKMEAANQGNQQMSQAELGYLIIDGRLQPRYIWISERTPTTERGTIRERSGRVLTAVRRRIASLHPDAAPMWETWRLAR
jgi:hypothetical protein